MSKDYVKASLQLIEKSSKAFIGSIDDDGYPNIKVMNSPREHAGMKQFYFSTNTSSLRVSQFLKNPRASLYFYDGRFFRGLMLKGIVAILQDENTRQRIWREGDTLYYKFGVTDPDYCVLRFTSECGRFYENFHSTNFTIE
jgi:general stress protein 26